MVINTHRCLAVFLILVTKCGADYSCLCNYNIELPVHSSATAQDAAIGYMYEFDCKPVVSTAPAVPAGWKTIAFEHQLGYVELGGQVEEQVCPGVKPDTDRLITTQPPTTPKPTTSSTTTTTPIATTRTTTTIPTTTTTTRKSTTTTTTTTTPTTPTTTIATPATPQETVTTTATTSARVTATTFMPIFSNNTPLRLVTTTTAAPSVTYGNTNLCPAILHQYTREDQGALQQYGGYCYEIVPIRAIWAKAENDCRAKGGHLVHIDSTGLQTFIYQWIKSLQFDHACWTGLHDLHAEEHFEWISGNHVIYQNFYSDRYGNLASHWNENCVLLVPYAPYFGKWDDVICGQPGLLGDTGQQNPFICEYKIHAQHASPLIG